MARGYRPSLDRETSMPLLLGIPVASVMIASLLPALLPVVAIAPEVPPLGLIMLLAWRFLVRDLWPVWIGLPLGLFDDLASQQPLGSAAFIWTVLLLLLDFLDRRMMWRDYKQDWLLGAGLLLLALALGLVFANWTGGNAGLFIIIPQALVAACFLPLGLRIAARLDRVRWRL